jgi:hypothetical protein
MKYATVGADTSALLPQKREQANGAGEYMRNASARLKPGLRSGNPIIRIGPVSAHSGIVITLLSKAFFEAVAMRSCPQRDASMSVTERGAGAWLL